MDTAATWPAMLRWASRPTPLPRSPPPVRQVNLKLLSRVFPEPSRSRTFLANFIDFSIPSRYFKARNSEETNGSIDVASKRLEYNSHKSFQRDPREQFLSMKNNCNAYATYCTLSSKPRSCDYNRNAEKATERSNRGFLQAGTSEINSCERLEEDVSNRVQGRNETKNERFFPSLLVFSPLASRKTRVRASIFHWNGALLGQ